MYQFTTTERNNEKASEYETKSMLYLFGCREDSKEMEVFIVDCFNDVSGADSSVQRIWDVQSKGVKSLNPRKIGTELITLFQNYLSDIAFEHYIFFMPKLKEMYLKDETLKYYHVDNFKQQYIAKIKQGLKEEYQRRNKSIPLENDIDDFTELVEFVIAEDSKTEYIKNITKFKSANALDDKFYDSVFDDIRNCQTILKNENINGFQIMNASEVLQYKKILWKREIDELVVNRILGINLFNSGSVPIYFVGEVAHCNTEEIKDIIIDCQSDIARLLFDKNGRLTFWRFFGTLLNHISTINDNNPRNVLEQLKKEHVRIPKMLEENSVVYLVAALMEELRDDN